MAGKYTQGTGNNEEPDSPPNALTLADWQSFVPFEGNTCFLYQEKNKKGNRWAVCLGKLD